MDETQTNLTIKPAMVLTQPITFVPGVMYADRNGQCYEFLSPSGRKTNDPRNMLRFFDPSKDSKEEQYIFLSNQEAIARFYGN